MKKQTEYTVKQLAEAFRPYYEECFYTAYAVVGNDRAAEKALIRAMLRYKGEVSEKEIVRAALEVKAENPCPVNFDCPLGEDARAGTLGEWLSNQSDELRRAVALRYRCGLDARETAEAMGISGAKLRKMLDTALRHASKRGRASPESALAGICRMERKEARLAPDFNTLIRALENRRASGDDETVHRKKLRGALNGLLTAAALLILAAVIWICVLLASYFRESYANSHGRSSANETTVTEDVHARV